MPNNPQAAEQNEHHTKSHIYRSMDDLYEEIFGRGDGDFDMVGPPDEDTDTQ